MIEDNNKRWWWMIFLSASHNWIVIYATKRITSCRWVVFPLILRWWEFSGSPEKWSLEIFDFQFLYFSQIQAWKLFFFKLTRACNWRLRFRLPEWRCPRPRRGPTPNGPRNEAPGISVAAWYQNYKD